MGKGRVILTDKDINFFKFLYKHRYCNLKAINILYLNKPHTLYIRLKKLAEFDYIRVLKTKNRENLYLLSVEGYKTLIKTDPEKEYKKRNITEQRLPFNVNHSLIIAEIGAMLSIRKLDYEIDLNIKLIFPEWKLIPDILLFGKIGFEVELENKNVLKYRKKLSELQKTKEIANLIYISVSSTESLRKKITAAGDVIQDSGADTDIIINSTMEKIGYIDLKYFMENIDKYLNKLNMASAPADVSKTEAL
ncbi:MAG: hypothetical protein ACYDDB_01300 [bacterium]